MAKKAGEVDTAVIVSADVDLGTAGLGYAVEMLLADAVVVVVVVERWMLSETDACPLILAEAADQFVQSIPRQIQA